MLLLLALLLVAAATPFPAVCGLSIQCDGQPPSSYVPATACAPDGFYWCTYTTPYAPEAPPFTIDAIASYQQIDAENLALGEYAFVVYAYECGVVRHYWINYTREIRDGVIVPAQFALYVPMIPPRLWQPALRARRCSPVVQLAI